MNSAERLSVLGWLNGGCQGYLSHDKSTNSEQHKFHWHWTKFEKCGAYATNFQERVKKTPLYATSTHSLISDADWATDTLTRHLFWITASGRIRWSKPSGDRWSGGRLIHDSHLHFGIFRFSVPQRRLISTDQDGSGLFSVETDESRQKWKKGWKRHQSWSVGTRWKI